MIRVMLVGWLYWARWELSVCVFIGSLWSPPLGACTAFLVLCLSFVHFLCVFEMFHLVNDFALLDTFETVEKKLC